MINILKQYTNPGNADLIAAGLHHAAGSSGHHGGIRVGHQASNGAGIRAAPVDRLFWLRSVIT